MSWSSIAARPVAKVIPPQIKPEPARASWAKFNADLEIETKHTFLADINDTAIAAPETPNGWGDSTHVPQVEEHLNPSGSMYIPFCLNNKDAILKLQSSEDCTVVFQLMCVCCKRFYKHCMFSNKEHKNDYPSCLWCRFDPEVPSDISIHHHIHCNRGGKKECGLGNGLSLERPEPKVKAVQINKDQGFKDIREPDVLIKNAPKKLSQKEKKRLDREASDLAGA
ncbi:hypothetical protein VTL71DRAFT_6127 [Oculimacula yallundae]|uniref:Uncharacterized protein n=1 Tax=Oculimacula yallundae TaxID=86028 RepID=A0ABR4BZG9_9HELO